jgi:3-methyladenine DNA glycosylase/8-oxoguanine DNA glycosylase
MLAQGELPVALAHMLAHNTPMLAASDLPVALAHLRAADPHLAALLDAAPCTLDRFTTPPSGSAFAHLARTIVGQQLHDAAAHAIHERVLRATAPAGGTAELSPAELLAAPEAELRAAGLSAAKLRALRDLAARFVDGRLCEQRIRLAADDAALRAELTAVVGVGPWTVDMFFIFSLRRPDVLPVGDLAVRKGFLQTYGGGASGGGASGGGGGGGKRKLPSAARMLALAEAWRPYRSIGAALMWHAHAVGANGQAVARPPSASALCSPSHPTRSSPSSSLLCSPSNPTSRPTFSSPPPKQQARAGEDAAALRAPARRARAHRPRSGRSLR